MLCHSFSKISFLAFFTCYSSRCFLFLLVNNRFLHSMMFCKILNSRILCMLHHMMFVEFMWMCEKQFCVTLNSSWKILKIMENLYYLFSTHLQFGPRTSFCSDILENWFFERCPFWFTLNSLPFPVKYPDHFLMKLKYMNTFMFVKITFDYDSTHALPLGVLQDYLYDSLKRLSPCNYYI